MEHVNSVICKYELCNTSKFPISCFKIALYSGRYNGEFERQSVHPGSGQSGLRPLQPETLPRAEHTTARRTALQIRLTVADPRQGRQGQRPQAGQTYHLRPPALQAASHADRGFGHERHEEIYHLVQEEGSRHTGRADGFHSW